MTIGHHLQSITPPAKKLSLCNYFYPFGCFCRFFIFTSFLLLLLCSVASSSSLLLLLLLCVLHIPTSSFLLLLLACSKYVLIVLKHENERGALFYSLYLRSLLRCSLCKSLLLATCFRAVFSLQSNSSSALFLSSFIFLSSSFHFT